MKHFFRTQVFSLIIVTCALVIVNCDNFNVREEIDNAAWEAKAPRITVLPNVRDGTGVVAPSNTSFIAKQHITMEVSYNLTNTDYSFVGWQAYQGDVRQNYDWDVLNVPDASPLPPDQVLILTDSERPTTIKITVRLSGGTITLVPVVTSRPRVVSFEPIDGGIERPVILNSPVVIQFSTPMNLASLSWGMNADGTPVWKKDGKFKNISITGRGTFGQGEPFPFEDYYDASIDSANTILTFTAKKDLLAVTKPYFTYVYVDLDSSIQAAGSGAALGTPGHYKYYIDNKWDSDGPVVALVAPYLKEAGAYVTVFDPETKTQIRKVSGGDTIHLVVAAYDSIDKGNLKSMKIEEGSSLTTVPLLDIVNRYNTGGVYADLQTQVEAAYGKLPGVFFVLPYQLKSGGRGIVKLVVYCYDQTTEINPDGNPSQGQPSSSVTLTRQ
jgi:hypothetical protein